MSGGAAARPGGKRPNQANLAWYGFSPSRNSDWW